MLGWLFISAAALMYTCGLEYLAVVLVLLYAGALMVLFAFVVLIGLSHAPHPGPLRPPLGPTGVGRPPGSPLGGGGRCC